MFPAHENANEAAVEFSRGKESERGQNRQRWGHKCTPVRPVNCMAFILSDPQVQYTAILDTHCTASR
jgi:hypothetical protein